MAAPIASNISATVSENLRLAVLTVDFTDADPFDTQTISFAPLPGWTLVSPPSATDTFIFVGADIYSHLGQGETLTETFTYTVTDQNGFSDTATASIVVEGINNAPTASVTSLTVDQATGFALFTPVFTDPDLNDQHTFTFDVHQATTGNQVIDYGGGQSLFLPGSAYDYLGQYDTITETFSYTVTDSAGATSTETLEVTINGKNDAPVANNMTLTISEDDYSLTFTPDAIDPDQWDSLTFSFFNTTGPFGAVTDNFDGTFTIQIPFPHYYDYLGAGETLQAGTLEYTATDSSGASDYGFIQIVVEGENDAPEYYALTATASLTTITEDNRIATFTSEIYDNDANDTLTLSVDLQGKGIFVDQGNGTGLIIANDLYDYLSAGESVTETFTYTATDSAGASATAQFDVVINGVNDGPEASFSSTSITEDDLVAIWTANYTDPDLNDVHTVTVDSIGASNWTALGNVGGDSFAFLLNGNFDYLTAGETVTDTIFYTVDDGNGGFASASAELTIVGVNDAPEAANDTLFVAEDNTSVTFWPLASDADDPLGALSFAFTPSNAQSTITDNLDGSFTFSTTTDYTYLDLGETASEEVTYTVTDASGAIDSAVITINIDGFDNMI